MGIKDVMKLNTLVGRAVRTSLFLSCMISFSEALAQSIQERVIAANTDFGFNLLRQLAVSHRGENVLLSPLGAGLLLSIAANGARGQTLLEIQRTLKIDSLTRDEANAGYASWLGASTGLQSYLQKLNLQQLEIASSLWGDTGFAIKPAFIVTNQTTFRAQVFTVDFRDVATVPKINSWVRDQTKGKISAIVQAPLPPEECLLALNAIYFKDTWRDPFDTNQTRDMPFSLASGQLISLPAMSNKVSVSYYEDTDLQMVALPYIDDLEMYVLLPKISIDKFITNVTSQGLLLCSQRSFNHIVDIELPRFELRTRYSLKGALERLGIRLAFLPATADFQGISAEHVWISDVEQSGLLKVDERGTEASVASMLGFSYGYHLGTPIKFVVDHPFVVAVGNEREGFLFLGLIMDPRTG